MAQDRACDVPKPTSTGLWTEFFNNQLLAHYQEAHHDLWIVHLVICTAGSSILAASSL
ncbi:MAG: hypothetical protein AB7F94_12440 [Nitrospira sp.]